MVKLYTLDNQFIKNVDINALRTNNFTGIVEHTFYSKEWFLNGLRHRINGPAIEFHNGTKQWYFDGKYCTNEQHSLLVSIMELKGLI